MGLLKEFKELRKDVKAIKESQDSFSKKNVEKIKDYDRLKEQLNNIKLEMVVKERIGQYGDTEYVISYKLPDVVLNFDENGEFEGDPLFTAINSLDLISIDNVNQLLEIFRLEKLKKLK